ncbi:Hypothetical predicted protein [Olea europaea subsp. europaea]|uniref:Uncharacterized protein n=1 Tax=Olea europaea subsp. europaea TaxID=158383 RepID=A0A8S0UDH8_OLEEU|nr:Hypothetical predicted protein [Olea europaea subsp. europaea]
MANPRAPPPTQQGGGGVTEPMARGKTFADIVAGKMVEDKTKEYHVTYEGVEIMTRKIGNKITIEQQMTHSTEEAEIVTEVLKEPGDLPKAPDFNEEEIESFEHIDVEHQNECLTLEENTGNETPLQEFGDYHDILQ